MSGLDDKEWAFQGIQKEGEGMVADQKNKEAAVH